MKSTKVATITILILVFMLTGLCACNPSYSEDIVILFTNDVHGGIDGDIGYAGVSAYKKSLGEQYRYLTLVDCGDFSQGSYECAVSKGEYMVELMNEVGYDFAILGNHEFDYGMPQLQKLIKESKARFLNCNMTYTGKGEDWVSEMTTPYEIKTYGKTKVAFLGVSTPWSIMNSTPLTFMEDGEFVYDFCGNNGGQYFYDSIQKYVDECHTKGADYVVVLSHLGMDENADSPFTSFELIANTNGIDVVLDAHSHFEASCWIRNNKDGKDVLVSSTGTQLNNIGKLVITKDGTIALGYVEDYAKRDEAITAKIEAIRSEYEEEMNAKVGYINVELSCSDSDGVRMVRSRELAIGDFVADAYRAIGGADIGMCNGGGIKADLHSGDVSYKNIIDVNPYGNTICVVKITGAELLDMLEYFYRNTKSEYVKDGKAYGEDGSFQQVSGLQLTINTSVESSVVVDDTDALVSIGGARRVSDVKVLKNGVYVPINPDETYTLASHNYMIKKGGSGMLNYLDGHELVVDESISDYQALINYINMLGGDLSKYESADSRIIVK